MSPLTGTDLYDWIGLRRVNGGRLVKLGQRWLHSGHPVPDYVAEALTALHTRGVVTLTGPDPKKRSPGSSHAHPRRDRPLPATMPPTSQPGQGVGSGLSASCWASSISSPLWCWSAGDARTVHAVTNHHLVAKSRSCLRQKSSRGRSWLLTPRDGEVTAIRSPGRSGTG
jgi:hypothetical protein